MLYHLSTNPNLIKLTPKLPSNPLHSNNNSLLEDRKYKRISFSPTIQNCILGLQPTDNLFKENGGKLKYFVYQPKNIEDCRIVPNQILIDKEYVFDAKITKEVWVMNGIEVKNIGYIVVYPEVLKEIEFIPLRLKYISKKDVEINHYLNKNGMITNYERKYDFYKL